MARLVERGVGYLYAKAPGPDDAARAIKTAPHDRCEQGTINATANGESVTFFMATTMGEGIQ